MKEVIKLKYRFDALLTEYFNLRQKLVELETQAESLRHLAALETNSLGAELKQLREDLDAAWEDTPTGRRLAQSKEDWSTGDGSLCWASKK